MFPPAPSHVAPTPYDTRLPAPEIRVNNAVGEGMQVGSLAGRPGGEATDQKAVEGETG